MSAAELPHLRKGQRWLRSSDGFVFRVETVCIVAPGAFMRCVDAARVLGWFEASSIARDFVRLDGRACELAREARGPS